MSSEQPINYEAVLSDLEAKRAALDAIIAGLRQLVGAGGGLNLSPTSATPMVPPINVHEVDAGTFFNMSIPDAARKFLRMTKRKQKTRVIADALQKGGIHSTAKDFRTMVYSILDRQEDVVRVGNEWGLAEWYPALKSKGKRAKGEKAEDEKEDEKVAAVTGRDADAA